MAREFYTKEEKKNHIALCETSGMTRKEYATSNRINEGTFYEWLEKNQQTAGEMQKGFVESKQSRIDFEEKIKMRNGNRSHTVGI